MAKCFDCERPHNFLVKVVFTINTSGMRSIEERLFCPLCFRERIGLAVNKEANEIARDIIADTVADAVRYFPELKGKLSVHSPAMLELYRRLTRILESEVK